MTKVSAFAICLAGVAAVVIGPAMESLGGATWHIAPYVAIALFVPFVNRQATLVGAALAMALIDAWVAIEWLAQTTSPALQLVELVSGIKAFVLLPFGALVGYLVSRMLQIRGGLKS
jgi:hypothetical protein